MLKKVPRLWRAGWHCRALDVFGLPYVIDSFDWADEVSTAKFGDEEKLEGVWNEGMLPVPRHRHGQYPVDFAITNFPLQ